MSEVPSDVAIACVLWVDDAAACEVDVLTDHVPYDRQFEVGCHNCYERSKAAQLTEALGHTSAIELDIWDERSQFRGGAKPRQWFVRHGLSGGNRSNCSGPGAFADCLSEFARWMSENPTAPVLTVFVDKKQDWGDGRRPSDLDGVIAKAFPAASIVRPGDLNGGKPPRLRADRIGWPAADSLRGKVLFVLTGGALANHNRTQHRYVTDRGSSAVMFVAPDVDEVSDVTGAPNQFSAATAKWIAFANIKAGDDAVAKAASKASGNRDATLERARVQRIPLSGNQVLFQRGGARQVPPRDPL